MQRLKYVLLGTLLICVAAFLHYALPQVDVVRLVDTDVKRVDVPIESTESAAESSVRSADVYFILAETADRAPRNYRNEDAFIYGKWDSADLHTKAKSIAQNPGNLVAVRHYGWRIAAFSIFPNAVAVWDVEPGYTHLPLFNIVFLTLLAGLVGYLFWRVRNFRKRLAKQRADREAERIANEARRNQDGGARAEEAKTNRALEDFLSDGAPGKDKS
jgi:hypothetical protein